MIGIFKRIGKWFDIPRDLSKPPAFYGRATTIDGRRSPIRPEDREAYEENVKRIVEAAQKGYRR